MAGWVEKMSVRETHFIIYGIVLPYLRGNEGMIDVEDKYDAEESWIDLIEPYSTYGDKTGKMVVISDGMGGAYTVVGHCYAQSGEYSGFGGLMRLPQIDMSNPKQIIEFAKWRQDITDLLVELKLDAYMEKNAISPDLGWIVFTNYR